VPQRSNPPTRFSGVLDCIQSKRVKETPPVFLKLIVCTAIGVLAGSVLGQYLLGNALSGIGAGIAFGMGLGLGVHALSTRE